MGKLTILVLAGALAAGGLAACSSDSGGCARAVGGVDAYAEVAMKGGGGGGGGHSGSGSGSGGKSGTSGGTSGRSGSGSTSGKSGVGGSSGTAPHSFAAPLRPATGVPQGYSGFRPYGGSAFGYYYRGAPYPWWYWPAGGSGARSACQSSSPSADDGGNF